MNILNYFFFSSTLDYIGNHIQNDTIFDDESLTDLSIIHQFNARKTIEYDNASTAINTISHVFSKLPEPVLSIFYFDRMSKVILSNKSYVKVLPSSVVDIKDMLLNLPSTSLEIVIELIQFMKKIFTSNPENETLKNSVVKWITLLLFGKSRLDGEEAERKAFTIVEYFLFLDL